MMLLLIVSTLAHPVGSPKSQQPDYARNGQRMSRAVFGILRQQVNQANGYRPAVRAGVLLPLEAPIVPRVTPFCLPCRRLPCAFRRRLFDVGKPRDERARFSVFYRLAELDEYLIVSVLAPVHPLIERVITHAPILRRVMICCANGQRRTNALLHIRCQT